MNQFEAHRPLMFSIAYRMLGSAMEAEDIVQDAFLRYRTASPDSIESHKAFLTTMVTRMSINALQSARMTRESYVGPWLPEPLHQSGEGVAPSPDHQIGLDESVSMAFLVLLESLTPVERAVFLLREIFEFDYAEIARIVNKEEAACRQLLSRAKKHIAERRPRFMPGPEEHRRLVHRFAQAVSDGDLDGLIQVLAEDVTTWADGGGKVRGAATRPITGRSSVVKFLIGSSRLLSEGYQYTIETVNGEPAIIVRTQGRVATVIFVKVEFVKVESATVEQALITDVWAIGNPDKLKHIE